MTVSYCTNIKEESARLIADFLSSGYIPIVRTEHGQGRYYCRLRHRLNGNTITVTADNKTITIAKNRKRVKTVMLTPRK